MGFFQIFHDPYGFPEDPDSLYERKQQERLQRESAPGGGGKYDPCTDQTSSTEYSDTLVLIIIDTILAIGSFLAGWLRVALVCAILWPVLLTRLIVIALRNSSGRGGDDFGGAIL